MNKKTALNKKLPSSDEMIILVISSLLSKKSMGAVNIKKGGKMFLKDYFPKEPEEVFKDVEDFEITYARYLANKDWMDRPTPYLPVKVYVYTEEEMKIIMEIREAKKKKKIHPKG